ncbi:MAG TPA: hypothetical protein VL361_08040 [Candidatus Limnocylindrales bacterium]|jgi:hypothetical protein|nr:hypothetical protein [Candidatus Limnocylindrales bacterium]
MKASFQRRPPRPLDRSTARNSVLINQLATPGLGSLLARRWVAGTGQLLLAVAGFAMVVGWFVTVMIGAYRQLNGGPEPRPMGWLGEAGALTFAAAWLWALITSLSLLRQTKAGEALPPLGSENQNRKPEA